MNFILDDEQQMLADTVGRFVQDKAAGSLADLGLFGLNVPENHGGIGGGAVETLIVMEALGRGLVKESYIESGVIAPRLLARHGSEAQKDRFLPRIARGELRLATAFLEPQSRYDLHDVRTRAERTGDGWRLGGAKSVVLHGDSADWFIVTARTWPSASAAEGLTLFLVDARAPGVTVQGFPTIDNQRCADVRFDGVQLDASAVVGAPDQGLALAEWALDQGLAALAAEAVGCMDKLTELTCEYLATRKQFGVAIGSFQALQHRAADMRIAVEQARALALAAAAHVQGEDRADRRRAVSAAKAMAGRSGRFVGQQATQLHGGMGMTDEMACGHYFKRLTAIDMTWGNTEHHVELYGDFL
jgi:alkylation response protein AidB-like acyl-CoA dehydrogenase